MELDHIRILTILEELSQRDFTSQRELSRKLNISLGLVNSFIKRLVKKGYFKVSSLPKNRLRYILTPKGVAEKTKLTCEYFQYSLEFYKNARKKIYEVLEGLGDQGVEKVAIYGSGEISEILYILLQQTTLELAAVIDPEKCGQSFMGRTLLDVKEIASIHYDIMIITEIAQGQSIEQFAVGLNIPCEKIALIH